MTNVEWVILVMGLLTVVLGLELLCVRWGTDNLEDRAAGFNAAFRGYFITALACMACLIIVGLIGAL